jgi:REase_DpnII-MboI
MVFMSELLVSTIGQLIQSARARLRVLPCWPDQTSGFAYKLLKALDRERPDGFSQPLRIATPQLLRRAPELAAFGYVITETRSETQSDWAQAFDRLMGRDAYPSDRNSFVYNPLELLGIAFGVKECAATTDQQRTGFIDLIEYGISDRQFVDFLARAAVSCTVAIVNPGRIAITALLRSSPVIKELKTEELLLGTAIEHLSPGSASLDVVAAEQEIAVRVLSEGAPVRDAAEAAALYISLDRVIQRASLDLGPGTDPVMTIISLCRRFPLFVDRFQFRQRGRTVFVVGDEYDVQDLLHAILKLHFDDIRPEEWTPSYAGNASRTDFFLPRERTIIEAKMTRSGLGQKDVANQLIIDVARYSKMTQVDVLVCLVYDPDGRCTNPSALEDDLAKSEGRLRVSVVVCPRGT